MSMTKEEILAVGRRPVVKHLEAVPVVGDAYIRRLSGSERDAWEFFNVANSWTEEDEKANRGRKYTLKPTTPHYRATLVVKGWCDSDGKRLFSDGEIPLVGDMDGELLDYLYTEIRRHSGMDKASAEDIRKNSDSDPSDVGGSD